MSESESITVEVIEGRDAYWLQNVDTGEIIDGRDEGGVGFSYAQSAAEWAERNGYIVQD